MGHDSTRPDTIRHMEPASLWQAIKFGRMAWLAARPVTRIKKRLNKRRARKGKPLLEINERRDEGMVKEIAGSFARTLAPAATAFLAGSGVNVGDGSNPTAVLALAAVVYVGAQLWSIARKIFNKPRDV